MVSASLERGRASVIAAVVVASAWVVSGQQATFRSAADAVRVDVLVTDNGRPVVGLAAADFEVMDNGVLQTTELVGLRQLPVNLVLVLDVSESVQGDRLEKLRDACSAMIGALRPADRASLLTFNHRVSLRVPLTSDLARVNDALKSLAGTGGTSLRDAAFSGLQLAASAGDGRSLVMVFSDGVDRSSWLRDVDLVAAARQTEATVYAVTVGHDASPVLRDTARATGGELFEASGNQNLRAAFLRVIDDFGSRYLLGYTPRGPARAGWHSITVRVRGRDYKVKARPGYLRPGPP